MLRLNQFGSTSLCFFLCLLCLGFCATVFAKESVAQEQSSGTENPSSPDAKPAEEVPSDLDLQIEALKSQAKTTFEAARERIKETAREGLKKLDPDSPEAKLAREEIEKLFQIEYRVLEFDGKAGAGEMEAALGKLGQERWDCFSIVPTGNKVKVFCKRLPMSYLRHATRLLGTF
jgi:hypothetical protein